MAHICTNYEAALKGLARPNLYMLRLIVNLNSLFVFITKNINSFLDNATIEFTNPFKNLTTVYSANKAISKIYTEPVQIEENTAFSFQIKNSKNELLMIHSSTSRGIIEENVYESAYWSKRIISGRNLLN